MPILSVVTVTYNRIDSLRKNLNSVKNQTYKDIEHIIVDNLSSDGTDDLVNKYKCSVSYSVKYIREKDNGIYQAMNKGIKASKGKWIHLLNSDDVYKNREVLTKIFNNDLDGVDVIASAIEYKNKGKDYVWIPYYDKQNRHYNFPHPGVFIRKEFYDRFGVFNEKFKMAADAVFMAENFKHAKIKIFKNLSVVMAGGGNSSIISVKYLKERLITILYYHNFPVSYKIRLIAYLLVDLVKWYILWPIKKEIFSSRKTS